MSGGGKITCGFDTCGFDTCVGSTGEGEVGGERGVRDNFFFSVWVGDFGFIREKRGEKFNCR